MNDTSLSLRYSIPLVLICVGGAFLRFHNLTTQGLAGWDEGEYLLRSLNLDYINAVAKPFHVILVRLGIEMFGVEEYAGQLVSATLGVATLFLAFLIGRRLYTPATGLVFSALMAVSYNHVYYSRVTYPQSDSTFFLMLSVLFLVYHLRGSYDSSWRMAPSGLALGLSFACHPNVAATVIYLCVFVVIISAARFNRTRNASAFTDMLVFGASALSILLIFSTAPFFASSNAIHPPPYLTTLVKHAHANVRGEGSHGIDYLYYYKQILRWEGTGKMILTASSLVVTGFLIVRGGAKRTCDLFTLALALFPLLFWSVHPIANTTRHYTHMLVGLDLAIARSVVWLGSNLLSAIKSSNRAQIAIVILPCALVLWLLANYGRFNLAEYYTFMATRTKYAKTMDVLNSLAGENRVAVSALIAPPLVFSLYKDRRLVFANSPDEARACYDKGTVRYMLHMKAGGAERRIAVYLDEFDYQLSLGGLIRPVKGIYRRHRIYDLAEVFSNKKAGEFFERKRPLSFPNMPDDYSCTTQGALNWYVRAMTTERQFADFNTPKRKLKLVTP